MIMTLGMDTDAQLAQFFAGMWPHLDEHACRLVAASKAVELGYGGISRPAVAPALDMQERPHAGGGTGSPAPSGQSHQSRPTAAGERLHRLRKNP